MNAASNVRAVPFNAAQRQEQPEVIPISPTESFHAEDTLAMDNGGEDGSLNHETEGESRNTCFDLTSAHFLSLGVMLRKYSLTDVEKMMEAMRAFNDTGACAGQLCTAAEAVGIKVNEHAFAVQKIGHEDEYVLEFNADAANYAHELRPLTPVALLLCTLIARRPRE